MGVIEKLLFYTIVILFCSFFWWMVIQLIGNRDFLTALAVIAVSGFFVAIFYHSKED